ncbi:MAG: hypothetical protein JWO07_812 [Candidatus Saccharibacteria bacterium]|nr:hypothetical protein [Candidatus Saccharibacteria bacterium]
MSDREYNALKKQEIERLCKDHFNVDLQVSGLVIADVPTYNNSFTTIFKSGHQVYALCEAETPVTLGRVRSIIKQMGMEAEAYYEPGQNGYFTSFARDAFLSVFPGRGVVNDDDLSYYKTLAPYSPALIRIKKINGQIRQYNPRSGAWQKTLDFSYFHPKVDVR